MILIAHLIYPCCLFFRRFYKTNILDKEKNRHCQQGQGYDDRQNGCFVHKRTKHSRQHKGTCKANCNTQTASGYCQAVSILIINLPAKLHARNLICTNAKANQTGKRNRQDQKIRHNISKRWRTEKITNCKQNPDCRHHNLNIHQKLSLFIFHLCIHMYPSNYFVPRLSFAVNYPLTIIFCRLRCVNRHKLDYFSISPLRVD